MRDFHRNNKTGGRGGRSFAGRSSGGAGGGDRPMFQATCSGCGRDCQVPFRPTGNKPVYCHSCFGEKGGSQNRGPSYRQDHPRQTPTPDYHQQFAELSNKLDAVLDAVLALTPPQDSQKPATKKQK